MTTKTHNGDKEPKHITLGGCGKPATTLMLNTSKDLQPLVEHHTLRIDKLTHNLHNTNQWCIQAAQIWKAAHMRFQVMEQRIARIEQSPPSVKGASLVDPKATCQSPPFSLALQQVPEVTTRIFLAPVLT